MKKDLRPADITKNSEDLDDEIRKHMQRNQQLYPLRLNRTTVIYVTKNKCTPQYAEKARIRMNLTDKKNSGATRNNETSLLDEKELRHLYITEGLTGKEIAERKNISRSSVYSYLKYYCIEREERKK